MHLSRGSVQDYGNAQRFEGVKLDEKTNHYLKNDRIGRGLKMWHREMPQIDSSGKAVVGRVLHLHQLIEEKINRNLSQFGLKYPSYAILATIRVSGAPYRMTPGELLSSIVLSSGGLSNLLRKLEAEGYVQRSGAEGDGRSVIVQLTEKGVSLAERAMAAHAELELEIIATLSTEERDDLAQLLSGLVAANNLG